MFPLRKVVLFKHGVGYFERQKKVNEDEAGIDFFFKEVQMNDVLKSLTAADTGQGGVISSISYQTQVPINETLEGLSLKLSDGVYSLSELLQQSVGASVSLTLKEGGRVDGTVLAMDGGVSLTTPATKLEAGGPEALVVPAAPGPMPRPSPKPSSGSLLRVGSGDQQGPHPHSTAGKIVHLLTDDSAIRSFPLSDLRSFVYKDAALKQDLQHLLDTLLNMKKKDLKRVTLFSRGKGARTIIASYVIEAPVWKTSYRLQLALTAEKSSTKPEEGAPAQDKPGWKKPEAKEAPTTTGEGQEGISDGKPDKTKHWLQGWCLVDNTQDEDWDRVALTLIGGRPNSFKHDLYGPRHRKRPVLQVQEQAPPKPPVLAEVLPNHGESLLKDAPALLSSLDAGGPVIGQIPGETKVQEKSIAQIEFNRPVAPMKASTVRQVKPVDVFQYVIPKPVSVKRGQSALVPFLSSEFRGQACELYNPSISPVHPLSVVLFKNTFGVTLDSGPITIYDEDTCIGETMLDSIRGGDERFLPYGTDKSVSVSNSDSQTTLPTHKTQIRSRTLTRFWWRVYEHSYSFDHKGGQHVQSMFIEHRFIKGDEYELWDTKEPASKTENFLRFEMRVNAGEITVFRVKQRKSESSGEHIERCSREQVRSWHEQKLISTAARDTLLNDLIPHRERVDAAREKLRVESEKLNQSLGALNSNTGSINGRIVHQNNYGGGGLWNYNEISSDIIAWTERVLADEPRVREYRATVRAAQEVLTREDTEFNIKFDKFQDQVVLNDK